MQLTLRKTVIGGETLTDDYVVVHGSSRVGRIRLATERNWRGAIWVWNVNPPLPVPLWCNGAEGSIEQAKAAFKAAWERFYASLTPGQG